MGIRLYKFMLKTKFEINWINMQMCEKELLYCDRDACRIVRKKFEVFYFAINSQIKVLGIHIV